jgi:hypothetical protein
MSKLSIATADPLHNTINPNGPVVLHQLADLIHTAYQLKCPLDPSGRSFTTTPLNAPRPGVQSVYAELTDTNVILTEIELLRTDLRVRPALDQLWDKLAKLKEGVRPLTMSSSSGRSTSSFRLELKISASSPLSASRHAVISRELEHINDIALWAQAEIPRTYTHAELERMYADTSDILKPIYPLSDEVAATLDELSDWSDETMEFMQAGPSIAVSMSHPVVGDICLSSLARAAMDRGRSLGSLDIPGVPAKLLLEASAKSPGWIVVPIERVCMGLSPYEVAEQMHALLDCLTSASTPAIFTGTQTQLTKAFHGGQGGSSDPFVPLLRMAPPCPVPELTRFKVSQLARKAEGIPESALEELTDAVNAELEAVPSTQRLGLVTIVANNQIHKWKAHRPGSSNIHADSFAIRASKVHSTLAGISRNAKSKRSTHLQNRLISVLESGQWLTDLKNQLLAQDHALEALVEKLRTEVLTRLAYQPIRYLAEGTPGTGKSESAAILAHILGVPLVTIDAASMSDFYVASAQLLGSGRGIVGSNDSGRLEKAAKNSHGVVIELSDLDHARESVRSGLSDLFLQLLEQGHFQTSTGAIIPACNIILAFTVNLPDSADERVGIPMGFNTTPSSLDMQRTVDKELKKLFSSAFLSRIGQPILFKSLQGAELAIIAERAIVSASELALTRLQFQNMSLVTAPGLGEALIGSLTSNVTSLGARTVAEHARTGAAKAIAELAATHPSLDGKSLVVTHHNNSIHIEVSP